jgi:hypothetical protein
MRRTTSLQGLNRPSTEVDCLAQLFCTLAIADLPVLRLAAIHGWEKSSLALPVAQ